MAALPSHIKYMLLALTGFTLWTVGDALIHYSGGEYPPYQIALSAALVYFVLIALFHKRLGGLRKTFTQPKLKLRILRGVIISLGALSAFTAFAHLELATAYAIIFTTPFLAKIFSVILLKEKIGWKAWAVTALGFAGVLTVLRPGVVPLSLGTAAALSLSFFFSLGHVMSRVIGAENQTLISLTLFNGFFLFLWCLAPTMMHFVPMTPHDLLMMLLIGTSSFVASLMVSSAFASAPTRFIAPIHYTQILFGTLWGVLLFSEFPDRWTIAGSLVIIAAGLGLVFLARETKGES